MVFERFEAINPRVYQLSYCVISLLFSKIYQFIPNFCSFYQFPQDIKFFSRKIKSPCFHPNFTHYKLFFRGMGVDNCISNPERIQFYFQNHNFSKKWFFISPKSSIYPLLPPSAFYKLFFRGLGL